MHHQWAHAAMLHLSVAYSMDITTLPLALQLALGPRLTVSQMALENGLDGVTSAMRRREMLKRADELISAAGMYTVTGIMLTLPIEHHQRHLTCANSAACLHRTFSGSTGGHLRSNFCCAPACQQCAAASMARCRSYAAAVR